MSHQKDLMGQYLEKIGRFALLNREQELKLAERVAEWVKLEQLRSSAVSKGDKQLQEYENLSGKTRVLLQINCRFSSA